MRDFVQKYSKKQRGIPPFLSWNWSLLEFISDVSTARLFRFPIYLDLFSFFSILIKLRLYTSDVACLILYESRRGNVVKVVDESCIIYIL